MLIKEIRWVLNKEDSETFLELQKKLGLRNRSEVIRFSIKYTLDNMGDNNVKTG
ncbi:hypothetical protein LCGC14_1497740 [marine sediment metagenome]|uniref:Ribbon-helix-helix protein CopG domain-containing protein n=1 Tax=marine sediment metagenome TaxID=412755 RepID=A0A0F9M6J6_9ZZZZ